MSRGPDAATLLERALRASGEKAGCVVDILRSDMTRWASATFTGARHLMTLTGHASPAFDGWIAALPDAELCLRGHLVADCVVMRVIYDASRAVATIEVLTLEEG
ncbi:hypothetical protein [Sphingomonas sp. M1-B02]|uniref:hypothetical protein n=1 Tax=Sphingomonas sp. M1-B02 TaxID=3114300 RepID=UPI002240A265|nr:hypothetical protein [Sphingomonas sp. S6-11]UZK66101.1 hypothetical protein OKW87_16580 [Sphingomonas sp. S6-11]